MTQGTSPPQWWQLVIIIGIGLLAVSSSSIFVRLAIATSGQSGPSFSLFLGASRLILASLFLLPAWRNISQKIAPRSAYYYAILAGVALAVHFATWTTSLSYTSIAASTTLVTTCPIWVALIAWVWRGERPSRWTGLGIAIACGGSVVIASLDRGAGVGNQPLLGNVLALFGAWMVSLYILWGREAQRYLNTIHYSVIAYGSAALLLFPLPFLLGGGYGGYPTLVYGYVLLMAIIPQGVGHTSFNWAVRWVSPTLLTLSVLWEPVLASLMGWWLFAEVPSRHVLIGAGLILLGVALAVLGSETSPKQRTKSV